MGDGLGQIVSVNAVCTPPQVCKHPIGLIPSKCMDQGLAHSYLGTNGLNCNCDCMTGPDGERAAAHLCLRLCSAWRGWCPWGDKQDVWQAAESTKARTAMSTWPITSTSCRCHALFVLVSPADVFRSCV